MPAVSLYADQTLQHTLFYIEVICLLYVRIAFPGNRGAGDRVPGFSVWRNRNTPPTADASAESGGREDEGYDRELRQGAGTSGSGRLGAAAPGG